jgi:hypothetical protein
MGTLGQILVLHRLAENAVVTHAAVGLGKMPVVTLLEVLSAGEAVIFLTGSHV